MAGIDPNVDAENRTRNKQVIQSHSPHSPSGDPESACLYCNDPKCGGHKHLDKKPKSQIWQTVQGNKKLDWRHRLDDPNAFINEDQHKRIGQTHHAIRENPTLKGAVKNERAHVIGSRVRMTYEPDYEAVGQDMEWAQMMSELVEDLWERDMEDPTYCWNDASGSQTFSEQMGLAHQEYVGSGEIFGVFIEEGRAGRDNRPMDTTFQFLDVSRLSTPANKIGRTNIVNGKKVNRNGRVTRYYVADEIPGSTISNRFTMRARLGRTQRHRPINPFNEWNSPQAVHWYDKERAGQQRALPELVSALKRVGMMNTFEETMLDAAVRDAAFAMWVESEFPNMGQAFSANPGITPKQYIDEGMGQMMSVRSSFYEKQKLELQHGSGRIPQLMPTESINSITPGTPSEAIAPFGNNMSTAIARAMGVDPYTYTGRMEGVNFSTIRAALLQTWQNRRYKRDGIFNHIGTPRFHVWFEEKIARGEIRMPIDSNRTLSHLNFFFNNRRALTMVEFHGPGLEQIDQIKGFRAQEGAINCALQTRTKYYISYTDTTFRKAVKKIAFENQILRDEGLGDYIKAGSGRSIGTQSNDRVPDGTTENRSN